MIYGEFTSAGQVQVTVAVGNGTDAFIEVDAVVDTGFMGALLLPRFLVSRLRLPEINQEKLRLANGSIAWFSVHEVVVGWHEEERIVLAHAAEGDALIGMEMLRGSIGTFEFIEGGMVTFEAAE